MAIDAVPGLLDKALMLLDAVVADNGDSALGAISARAGLPQATAYRLVGALVGRGFLIRCERGRYLPGPRLAAYARTVDPHAILARVATPFLRDAARRFGSIAHLGVLEGGMVTYLVKVGDGPGAHFTRQGMQLEAYCSGVGKVLLANLPDAERDEYLSQGPFVRLTANTIIDPDLLRAHLRQVRTAGFARDDAEISEDLQCIAVPAPGVGGAAISMSGPAGWLAGRRALSARSALDRAARAIAVRLGSAQGPPGRDFAERGPTGAAAA
jgi:DNA-binding IclR family transcriptional regulator